MVYKLIKEYPNSPKIGTVVKEDGLNQYVSERPLEIFSSEHIECYPEFWKPVLLITEDGVAIHDKETIFWRVDSSFNVWSDVYIGGCESHKCFSKEKAAQSYILKNKKYSLEILIECVNNWSMSAIDETSIIEYLKNVS